MFTCAAAVGVLCPLYRVPPRASTLQPVSDTNEIDPAASALWQAAQLAVAGDRPQRGAPSTSPVERYLDPSRHSAETAALRWLPHAIGPAARLANAGDWLSTQLLGVPVLACRGDDGELRAFINVCRHRGAIVAAPESCGQGRARFVCPYHSWTYDDHAASPHERRFVQPSNWKLVLDASLEIYHFQYAHRATIAPLFFDNVVQQQSFGRHQRIVLPKRTLAKAGGDAASWAQLGRHSNVIYFFIPATFLLWEGDHANVFNVAPAAPGSCATTSWMVVPASPFVRRPASHWARNWKIFWDAIDEDFALAASMQQGWSSGANAGLTFGANEFACDIFERAIDELVGVG